MQPELIGVSVYEVSRSVSTPSGWDASPLQGNRQNFKFAIPIYTPG